MQSLHGVDLDSQEGTEVAMKMARRLHVVTAILLVTAAGWAQDSGHQEHADRMAHEHRDDAPVANPASETEPAVPVAAEVVTYATIDDKPITGYIARPKGHEGPLPGLIVIHEWWGLNDNIRAMTRRLAGEGYTALAVDLYGGKTADDPTAARQLMVAAGNTPTAAEGNLRQAFQYLETEHDAPKVASIGWCFGGGWSLRAALLLPEKLDAAVIYYGRVVTDRAQLETLNMPILGIFGGKDRGIPMTDVKIFEGTLAALGKDATILVFPDADHAFANPSGRNWDPTAASQAWRDTVEFLEKHLKH
jgi:carboxymethylenebutenolidase